MSRPYIDRIEYHNELVKSKKQGKLTPRAIELFTIHANELVKCYTLSPDDAKDSVSSALHDFISYWHNFKESNTCQLKLTRNFEIGESINLEIKNDSNYIYTASDVNDLCQRKFKIGTTINHTLDNLCRISSDDLGDKMHVWLHKVKMKIGFMDKLNSDDLSIYSRIYVVTNGKPLILGDNKNIPTDRGYLHTFTPAPNCFSNLTSLARNGILKGINKTNPKYFKNSMMIRMGSVNTDSNGLYNI